MESSLELARLIHVVKDEPVYYDLQLLSVIIDITDTTARMVVEDYRRGRTKKA